VLGAVLMVGLGPRAVTLSLPATWRAEATAQLAELAQESAVLSRVPSGFTLSGRRGAGDFALPLATPAAAMGSPGSSSPGVLAPASASRASAQTSEIRAVPTAKQDVAVRSAVPAATTKDRERGQSGDAGASAERAPGPPFGDRAGAVRPTPPPDGASFITLPTGGPGADWASGGRVNSPSGGSEVHTVAGAPARRGALVFAVTALQARLEGSDRRRIDLRAAVQNVGDAPLAYAAATATLKSDVGETHVPLSSVAHPLGSGLLAPGDGTELELSFDLPAGQTRLTLLYDGLTVDLGDTTLRTFRSLPIPQ
jgi:hypothetical protein